MKKYDVFISYAIEDKDAVASVIADGLKKVGLKVYFTGDELDAGDLVSETVYEGLEKSRYYILILSHSYVRTWPIIERSHILRTEKKKDIKLIFPVWHNINMDEVKNLFPELIDHYAESTQTGLDNVIQNLYEPITKRKRETRFYLFRKTALLLLISLASILLIIKNIKFADADFPEQQKIESLVNARIKEFQNKIDNDFQKEKIDRTGRILPISSVQSICKDFNAKGKYVRNQFFFSNDWIAVTGLSNIQNMGLLVSASPYGGHGISSPVVWTLNDTTLYASLVFTDTSQIHFRIDSVFKESNDVHLLVSYDKYIRMVYWSFSYSAPAQMRKQQIHIKGFKPTEEYILRMDNAAWKIQEVK